MMENESKKLAPKGKFRVLVYDLFDHTDWIEGDFENVEKAQAVADNLAGNLLEVRIYNDRGEEIAERS